MDYDDRATVVTPEGVRIDAVLAGLGSRFGAALIDALIQGAVLIAALIIIPLALNGVGAAEALATLSVVTLVILIGYHIAFETLRQGRSPGKSTFGLRVVRRGGGRVTFWPSTLRNIMRLVDFLPSFYLVGLVAVFFSPRNQRLGDMAADTFVVREPRVGAPWELEPAGRTDLSVDLSGWEVSAVTAEELAAVRAFLDRRRSLAPEPRGRLAWEFAARLRPKVGGAGPELHPEEFLEHLVEVKLRHS